MKNSVKLMGVINVSPESFYKGSVPKNARDLANIARQLTKDGADIIDVGAMSTAPYLKTTISEREEAKRLAWAVAIIRKNSRLPISVDTSRYEPALAGRNAGATLLNDVTGLNGDPKLALIAKKFDGVILMAHPSALMNDKSPRPISKIKKILTRSIKKAVANGVRRSRIVIDPGIGFFRDKKNPWWKWDVAVLQSLGELKALRCPILIGVSRKSFIGHLLGGLPPEERLAGSLAATLTAAHHGATWVRTHDVKETGQVLQCAGFFALNNK
jgi:dihydropteroate synthase